MKPMDIQRTFYKVSDFVSWQNSKLLVLSPSFQRRPVWKPEAKSYLIDTIVRGLPIPIIFLRERTTDLKSLMAQKEVVDGQQRIRTVLSFIDPKLLKDYSDRDRFSVLSIHNPDIAKKSFKELPDDIKQSILDYQFSVHVLPSDTDDQTILKIFARINSTGVKLNSQELRNANYFGEFKTSMFEIAAEQLSRWRSWGIFDENNIARMEEVEMTSEFAMFMLNGLSGKSQKAIDKVYKQYDGSFNVRPEFERRFRFVMDIIDKYLGTELRFSPFKKKTLFYHVFLAIYVTQYGYKEALDHSINKPFPVIYIQKLKKAAADIEKKNAPLEVLQVATRRTTNLSTRKILYDYLLKVN